MILDNTGPAAEGLINEAQPDFDDVIGRERYASDKLHCALLSVARMVSRSGAENSRRWFSWS